MTTTMYLDLQRPLGELHVMGTGQLSAISARIEQQQQQVWDIAAHLEHQQQQHKEAYITLSYLERMTHRFANWSYVRMEQQMQQMQKRQPTLKTEVDSLWALCRAAAAQEAASAATQKHNHRDAAECRAAATKYESAARGEAAGSKCR